MAVNTTADKTFALLSSQTKGSCGGDRIHKLDGFLHDQEEPMTFRVAHRMLELGYWNHSAGSGVLVRANMLGRIVAWDKGLISWIARRHDPSLTVPVDNAGAVAGAISKLAHYHS